MLYMNLILKVKVIFPVMVSHNFTTGRTYGKSVMRSITESTEIRGITFAQDC